MNRGHSTLNFIARQYNEKWRFPDYDRAIKKLHCRHVHSFLSCNPQTLDGVAHDYDVPVYICRFSPTKAHGDLLAVANENGTVCVENANKSRIRTYVQTHNNTVFDLAWMPGEKQFVTVSGDHSAKLWDCGESNIRMVSEFLGHTRSVKCAYFKPENTSVFATGSRDGSLILWDARCARKCSKLPMSHTPDQVIPSAAGTLPYASKRKYYPVESPNSVTGLIFQNDTTLISSGSSDQCIRVWDMRKTYARSSSLPMPRYQLFAPSPGFSHISIDPAGTKIYANSMDSYIYCFNVNSYNPDPISAFYGHQNGSFYVKSSLSHDGWYLLSGSSDKIAYIWNTRNAELSEVAIKPVVALPGHTAEVACVVMSLSGDMKVATCSDDGTYRLWHNYNLEDASWEGSEIEDYDRRTIVRTQWKNKRKLSITEEVCPSRRNSCTFHAKICRYYSNSLSTFSCKCHKSGEGKRPSEGESEGLPAKRRADAERTPPREEKRVRASLKRKLSDLGNQSDAECKKRTRERALLPLNDSGGEESEPRGVGVVTEFAGTQLENCLRKPNSGSDSDSDGSVAFSSPTTNLPNYVKDGTSPYIHRCPKTQKENMDWLTKLRKSSSKPTVTDEDERSGGRGVVGAKRKLRIPSQEGKPSNQTLHKYFKISSRAQDICQDVRRKPIK